MKSLYESIIQSREPNSKIGESILRKSKVGVTSSLKSIFGKKPSPKGLSKLKEIWKGLGLFNSMYDWHAYFRSSINGDRYYYQMDKNSKAIIWTDEKENDIIYFAYPIGLGTIYKKVENALKLELIEDNSQKRFKKYRIP